MQLTNFIRIALLLALSCPALAKVKLPSVLNHNMVLQQRSDVRLWGTTDQLSRVKVQTSWNRQNYVVKADANGRWNVVVKTPAAGGPYTISFDDGERTTLENILIGEVWICSGQSNMAMKLKGGINQPVSNLHEALLSSNNDQVRLFTVAPASAEQPATDVEGEWKISNPEHAIEFSAVAFWYGEMLQKYLKIPVGLVVTAVGGTPARSWMDSESLDALPELKTSLNGKKPEVLYNAMIAPLTPYAVKGFLWYQGEADRTAPASYAQQLAAMVKGWRKAWGNEALPFYYVQIAPWLYPGDPEFAGAALREQQMHAAKQIPNAAMAVTLDIGSDQTIHPPEKKIAASRLAYIALAQSYGITGIPFAGPEYKSMTLTGQKVLLTFNQAQQGLYFTGNPNENFEIAGENHKFYPANAKITAKGIEVYSEHVSRPLAVRYAFKNYVKGNLYNGYGLPASSFRTDDWELP